MSDLGDWMTKVKAESVPSVWGFDDVDLPMATVTGESSRSISMTLKPDVILVEGMAVVPVSDGGIDPSEMEPSTASIKKLSLALRGIQQAVKRSGSAIETSRLKLVIDKMAPWNVVVSAVNSASLTGVSELEIIFNTPPKVGSPSPPPASSLTKEIAALVKFVETLAKTPAGERAALKNEGPSEIGLLAKLSTNCPALKEGLDTLADEDPHSRDAHILAAIQECQCKVEIPAFKELYWFSANEGIGKPGIGSVTVALTGSNTGEGTVIEAAGDSTWQDIHTKVVALASPNGIPQVVFRLKPSK